MAKVINGAEEILEQGFKQALENIKSNPIVFSGDTQPSVDYVNQPPHYMAHEMECIDELEVVLGGLGTYFFCLGNVWKYRYRADHKGNSEQDNKKSDWYMKKAKELKDRYDLDVQVG